MQTEGGEGRVGEIKWGERRRGQDGDKQWGCSSPASPRVLAELIPRGQFCVRGFTSGFTWVLRGRGIKCHFLLCIHYSTCSVSKCAAVCIQRGQYCTHAASTKHHMSIGAFFYAKCGLSILSQFGQKLVFKNQVVISERRCKQPKNVTFNQFWTLSKCLFNSDLQRVLSPFRCVFVMWSVKMEKEVNVPVEVILNHFRIRTQQHFCGLSTKLVNNWWCCDLFRHQMHQMFLGLGRLMSNTVKPVSEAIWRMCDPPLNFDLHPSWHHLPI